MNVDLLLILHAMFGFISLTTGSMVMLMKKQYTLHKVLGYVFVISTVISALCGVIIAIENEYWFFIHIAIATVLQIIMGLRILKNKKFKLNKVDIATLLVFLLNAIVMLFSSHGITFALGVLYMLIIGYQLYLFSGLREITKMMWLSQHISHMVGAFISILTAFMVGNIGTWSAMGFLWVVPAIIFFPVVRYFKKTYAPDRKILGVF